MAYFQKRAKARVSVLLYGQSLDLSTPVKLDISVKVTKDPEEKSPCG